MTKTQVFTEVRPSAAGRDNAAGTPLVMPAVKEHKRYMSPFWRHFLQMLAVMVVGMIATGAIFIAIVGPMTWDEVTTQYPTQSLVAMAAGMTVPMVAWMLHRRYGVEELLRDGGGDGSPGDPFLVSGLVRRHQKRTMRGLSPGHRRGDARTHALPP